MVMVEDVAQHQCGLFQPRHVAQRRDIRLHDEIAIALGPACRLVAGHRLHIDVVGEQIVAAMGLVMRRFDEIARPGTACRSAAPACRRRRRARCRSRHRPTAFFSSSSVRLPAIRTAPALKGCVFQGPAGDDRPGPCCCMQGSAPRLACDVGAFAVFDRELLFRRKDQRVAAIGGEIDDRHRCTRSPRR